MKWLFLALLAANVTFLGWRLFASPNVNPLPETDPGVDLLMLLSEKEGVPQQNVVDSPQPGLTLDQGLVCYSVGPFLSLADLRQVSSQVEAAVRALQPREDKRTVDLGYWVYLPALASRPAALEIARQLSQQGVQDYYVVTSGERENTISLGLFTDRMNAMVRRAEIASFGYDAQITPRRDEVPAYWLDYAILPGADEAWSLLEGGFPGVSRQSRPCT